MTKYFEKELEVYNLNIGAKVSHTNFGVGEIVGKSTMQLTSELALAMNIKNTIENNVFEVKFKDGIKHVLYSFLEVA